VRFLADSISLGEVEMGALANVIRPRMDAGRSLVAGMAMIMLGAASAEANVTYEYTGNDFTNVVSPYDE
jgi:hypothetical protein